MPELKIKTGWREKEPSRKVPSTEPKLYNCCWQCRKCIDVGYLFCKLDKKKVKLEDTCENFYGYFKGFVERGKKPHGKRT